MPDRRTSEDVLTRNTWLMYYIWRKREVRNNISELSIELGYKNDGALNKRVRDLVKDSYVEEVQRKSGIMLRLTSKGKQRILFLTLPKWALFCILVLSFVNIYNGLMELFLDLHVNAWSLLIPGIFLSLLFLTLLWAFRNGERQFLYIGRPSEEGQ